MKLTTSLRLLLLLLALANAKSRRRSNTHISGNLDYHMPEAPALSAESALEQQRELDLALRRRRGYWRSAIDESDFRCEPLIIDFCQALGYNYTLLPNMRGLERQRDIAIELNGWRVMLEMCDPAHATMLRRFFCMAMAPTCDVQARYLKPIGPCRTHCDRAERYAAPILRSWGKPWPVELDCDQFQPSNVIGKGLCMDVGGEAMDAEEEAKAKAKKERGACM